jgi:hypothetical protein
VESPVAAGLVADVGERSTVGYNPGPVLMNQLIGKDNAA